MIRRVGGLETEYGLVCVRSDGSAAREPEAAARELFRPVVARGRSSNIFLPNAARLYIDVGSHPEFATAEHDDWRELVAQDRAGDLILRELTETANAAFAEQGEDARIHLLKNNVDSAGNSFGSHENYLVDRRGEFTRLPAVLLPFLVTRQIVTGAGGVAPTDDGRGQFVFSRRSDHLWEGASSATTRARPLINTRDEPHGDSSRFRRLHVISGDSTMSELSTWLRFATTDLVLRLIESGRAVPDLSLQTQGESTHQAISSVARDLAGDASLEMADGSTTTAVALQQRYLDLVAPLAEDHERDVLETWQKALDAVRTGDRSWASRTLDWAIKEQLFEQVAERRGVELGDPQIERLDLAYHDLDVQHGLFWKLRGRGLAPQMLKDADVERLREYPPATTRAHLRGRFIRAAEEAGAPWAADWTSVRWDRQGQRPVQLMDPLVTESDAVDELIERMRGAAPPPQPVI